ncbi:hypothetical protein J6590_018849 [Homalodisca vitripennis]|nr:hypothetical protein J6590_018849 [Homalodisca vitripennis]
MVPKDLEHLVATACAKNPFKVVPMKTGDFIDFKELAKDYLNTKNLAISKISHFGISHKDLCNVRVKSLLGLEEDAMLTWTKVNVLKSNANLDGLPDVDDLQKIQFKCKIPQEKKKDLEGMIEYLQEENHKAFYRVIIDGSHEPALEEEGEEEAEVGH